LCRRGGRIRVAVEDGRALYFAAETNVFTDMQPIERLYHPALAFLRIGDLFPMSPRQAAVVCRVLRANRAITMRFGTFPALTGDARALGRTDPTFAGDAGLGMDAGGRRGGVVKRVSKRPNASSCSLLVAAVVVTAQTIEHEPEREPWQQMGDIFRANGKSLRAVWSRTLAQGAAFSMSGYRCWWAKRTASTRRTSPRRGWSGYKRVTEAHLASVVIINGSADDPGLPVGERDSVVVLYGYQRYEK
jgi:hypothetical protein